MGMQQKARPVIGGVSDLTAGDLVDELRAERTGSDAKRDLTEGRSPTGQTAHPTGPEGHLLGAALIGIERLRTLHHRIARTLAGFDGNVPAAAAVLGMDPGRIRNL